MGDIFGETSYIFEKRTKELKNIPYENFSIHKSLVDKNSNLQIASFFESGLFYQGNINLENQKFEWLISPQFPLSKSNFKNKLYFCHNNSEIHCYNMSSIYWKNTFEISVFDWSEVNYRNELVQKQAEIRRILGQHSDIVWVLLNSGRLLGLKADDGSLKFNIFMHNYYIGTKALFGHYEIELRNKYNWTLHLLQYGQLDEEKGVIFGLKNFYYFEIDLKDPVNSFTVFDASDSFLEHKIEADMAHGYEWTWHENEIFFGHNFTSGNNLAVFNRDSKTVTWAIRLEQENGDARNLSRMEYGSDTLYVLDQLKTLHVFKKEKTT